MLTPQLLAEILQQAASVPLHAMKEMQREQLHFQGSMAQQNMEMQTKMMKQMTAATAAYLAPPQAHHVQAPAPAMPSDNPADPLRKLREKDPQFPAFSGKTEHFLAWILECQTRKEQRDLHDAMVIQYAIIAMGETFRGLFPPKKQFASWEEFVKQLKPMFLLHTAEWSLFVKTQQWQMRGDWPRFHAIVQTYRMFLDASLQPALMVNMIKALDPYLQRKVVKPPMQTTLDEAVERTWRAFRTAQPPMPLAPQASAQAPAQLPVAMQTPMAQPTPAMDLDAMRQATSSFAHQWQQQQQSSNFNVFTGKPMGQTFGRSEMPARDFAQMNAVGFQAPSRVAEGEDRRRDDRDDLGRDRRRDGARDNRRKP